MSYGAFKENNIIIFFIFNDVDVYLGGIIYMFTSIVLNIGCYPIRVLKEGIFCFFYKGFFTFNDGYRFYAVKDLLNFDGIYL